jgi:hypothetical protein
VSLELVKKTYLMRKTASIVLTRSKGWETHSSRSGMSTAQMRSWRRPSTCTRKFFSFTPRQMKVELRLSVTWVTLYDASAWITTPT